MYSLQKMNDKIWLITFQEYNILFRIQSKYVPTEIIFASYLAKFRHVL